MQGTRLLLQELPSATDPPTMISEVNRLLRNLVPLHWRKPSGWTQTLPRRVQLLLAGSMMSTGIASSMAWILLFIFVFKEIDLLVFVYAPLAFSTGGLSWQNLTHAPPIMYRVFTMINSEEHPELYAQGTALLLIACLVLLAATLLVIRIGWRSFNQPRRR